MKTKEQIDRIKAIAITDYLSTKGFQPVTTSGSELVYYSPKNEEGSPSFFVNPYKNVFHDFSGVGEKGDIIRLIQYLDSCDFKQAIETLESNLPETAHSFSFSGSSLPVAKPSAIEIVNVQPLRNRALLAYTASRKISAPLAATYLQEVHYQIKQKRYYALGFKNDKGGYELRSQYFKGCTSPKWFKLITGQKTTTINLFEGVFDFLSSCEHFNTTQLKHTTLVLNSLAFVNEALPILTDYSVINAFLDNDKAGKRNLERLRKEGLNVVDCSHYYPDSKDFNDYIMQMRTT